MSFVTKLYLSIWMPLQLSLSSLKHSLNYMFEFLQMLLLLLLLFVPTDTLFVFAVTCLFIIVLIICLFPLVVVFYRNMCSF